MSDSPPPFGEDETKVDTVAAASSTIDIDLNDDKPSGGNALDTDEISVGNSASNTNTTSRHNDDLFFSTISDPEPNIEVYLGVFFLFV